MAIYHITAKLKPDSAAGLLQKLTDGTIADQRPDGAEIVAAMNRAVINRDGRIEWSEMCFCSSPLQHERATVLDHHFEDIQTDRIEAYQTYEGQDFMAYLTELAG